jgi:hypothetical protein
MKKHGRPRRKHRANKKAKRQQQIKKIQKYIEWCILSFIKARSAMFQIQLLQTQKHHFPPGGIIGKVGDEFSIPGRGNIKPLPKDIPCGELSGSEYVVSVKPKFKWPPMRPGANTLPADTPCDSL